MIKRVYSHLKDKKVRKAVQVQSAVRFEMKKFLEEKGFIEISPVIISPLTDPLRHETYEAKIDYYGFQYFLTKSMIFHKQIALISFDKVFSFSPNIRIETIDKKDTGRHLAEFTQLDLEIKHAKREDVIALVEEMLVHTISSLKKKFDLNVSVPKIPFEKITFEDAYNSYGKDFEDKLSLEKEEPFWIVDMPIFRREFYDYEYNPGTLRDMDLVYPKGFGEAASGGEREYQYERIFDRINRGGYNVKDFSLYLEFAKRGLLFPSAGIGIGIERLVRYICSLESIEYASLFPKAVGNFSI